MKKCLSSLICAIFIAASANAAETTTYTYDALGRLVGSTTTGGPANGTSTGTALDNVDNRTNYSVAASGTSSCQFFADDRDGSDEFTISVELRRTGTCSGPVVINYATADGTAQANVHYYSAAGSVTFQTTDATKYISIYPIFGSVSSSRTLFLNISIGSGSGSLGDGQAVVTIVTSN